MEADNEGSLEEEPRNGSSRKGAGFFLTGFDTALPPAASLELLVSVEAALSERASDIMAPEG